ncbi:TonB-dependent receptor domain-containing protein [Caulobacter endophyticus]|uniref:TonB-dependent receptor domain-containing protein n=1 Tax=Caulobacter endophyticus TaxID=2172652 RepID=UPI0024105191|nr:TonB-dependent receptor [Caulobacter endophyticus]MDG2527818.1 TonB-dependent receptor [Caulobacter endophyticus]
MQLRSILLAAGSLTALAAPTWALAAQSGPGGTDIEGVVVTADPLGRSGKDVISSVAVLTGEEFVQRRQATLGETLNGLPGVNSDTFGGGASRPVIRGQTAPRVKVLSEGAALMDASEVSPDHAVSGEPLLLEGVEILRGPSALLYGGGAIGGAVNLIDRKIPTQVPPLGGDGVAEVRFGSGDNERAGVVGLTAGVGQFAVRIEAAERKTDDYEVPDFESSTVPGSFNRTSTATLGLSWIGSRGYLGAAYTQQNSKYGLPGHTHEYESCHPHGTSLHCGGHDDHDHGDEEDHDHEHEDHGVPIVDLLSKRLDVRGEINDPFAGVERIRLRAGYTDYRHHEKEEGVIATTFGNEGYDARVEVQHAPIGGVRGVVGMQVGKSDFSAIGEEAFIPQSRTKTTALFVVEEYVAGDWRFEGALRQEWQEASAEGRVDTDHKPFSASAAASWTFTPGYVASLSVARSQRAPSAQELYARGVHLATNTYEIGSAGLDVETAASVELGLRKTQGATTFSASAYRYAYDGYIYADTLDRYEDFRLVRYSQDDATFTGLEGQVTQKLKPWLSVTAFGDYVRAKLKDGGGNLPRVPAGRLGARSDLKSGAWSGNVEYVRVFDQDRIATFENETPGYNMVNATVAYDLPMGPVIGQVFLRGANLLDERALNHASFVSTSAPLRGRNVVLGLRALF